MTTRALNNLSDVHEAPAVLAANPLCANAGQAVAVRTSETVERGTNLRGVPVVDQPSVRAASAGERIS